MSVIIFLYVLFYSFPALPRTPTDNHIVRHKLISTQNQMDGIRWQEDWVAPKFLERAYQFILKLILEILPSKTLTYIWPFASQIQNLVNISKYTRYVPKVYSNFEDIVDELPIFMSLGGQPGRILIRMCEVRCHIQCTLQPYPAHWSRRLQSTFL